MLLPYENLRSEIYRALDMLGRIKYDELITVRPALRTGGGDRYQCA